jgi:hypothetical protein
MSIMALGQTAPIATGSTAPILLSPPPTSCPMFQTLQSNTSGQMVCTADQGSQLAQDIFALPATVLSTVFPALGPTLSGGLGFPALAVSGVAWLALFFLVSGLIGGRR